MDFDIENQLKQQTVDLNIDDDFKDLEDEIKNEGGGGNDSDDELDKLENDLDSNDDFEDDDKNDKKVNEEMDEDDKLLAEMENNVDDNDLDENEEENNENKEENKKEKNENEKKENKIENEKKENKIENENKNSNDSLKRINQIKTNEVNPSTKKVDENKQEKAKKINDNSNSNILPDTKEFIKFSSDIYKKYSTLKITLPFKDNNNNKIDFFNEKSDKVYCKYEFMKSLSEILYEIKYVEEIINYKNKNKFKNVDYWKTKKENLQNSIKQISNNIKNAKLSGKNYGIKLEKENKLLKQ
jgi:hypothetical protein